jgi:hypothetical protein
LKQKGFGFCFRSCTIPTRANDGDRTIHSDDTHSHRRITLGDDIHSRRHSFRSQHHNNGGGMY